MCQLGHVIVTLCIHPAEEGTSVSQQENNHNQLQPLETLRTLRRLEMDLRLQVENLRKQNESIISDHPISNCVCYI